MTRTRWAGLRSPVVPLAALGFLTIVRLVMAAAAPLSPDEAYYWVWSRALAPGYLDHPPMVALWIRGGTALLGNTVLGVRLFAPFAAAAGSVLLVLAGNRLFPERRPGMWAAVLLNATLMLGAGAVSMTPDTPLLFFWTAAMFGLSRVRLGQDRGSPWWWLFVGVAAGLALESKYTAALLGVGIGLWLLTPGMRPQLRTVWPWAGGVLALVIAVPVVWWNAGHGWASVVKQGGRAADWHPGVRYLGELVAGQAGLATPIIAVLMVWGAVRATRRWRDPASGLVAALVVPGALVFLEHAIGDRVQANWVAVLYPGAALAAAAFLPRWRLAAVALGFAITALVYLQVGWAALPLPKGYDPTLRLAGYPELGATAAGVASQAGLRSLASEEYGLTSLLAFETGLPVVGNEARWRLFDLPAAPTEPVLLILSDRRRRGSAPTNWTDLQLLARLQRSRDGTVAEDYWLYRATPRAGAPAVMLPRPGS